MEKIKKIAVGGVYVGVSDDFQRGPLPGISRCLKASQHDAGVVERIVVASRGRNPDNPSDRTAGAPTEQRLEPNTDGVTNTLTTVQKDNYVLEKRYIWGGLQEHQLPREDGIPPTLTAAMGMGGGMTPIFTERGGEMEKEEQLCYEDDLIEDTEEIQSDNTKKRVSCYGYRIRKLTARECWRLMGYSDEDFNAAEAVNSNTQLYRQAGNAIVENVLVAIFGQMIPGKENTYKRYHPTNGCGDRYGVSAEEGGSQ